MCIGLAPKFHVDYVPFIFLGNFIGIMEEGENQSQLHRHVLALDKFMPWLQNIDL
jgi:hypothetical protein